MSEGTPRIPEPELPSLTNDQTKTPGSTTPTRTVFRRLTNGLREALGSFDVRDKRVSPEKISEQAVASAIDRLTNITGANPFDVRSVMAEMGYYGDPSSNPEYLMAEDATRRRLFSISSLGGVEPIALDDPNLHDQRVMFRVTDQIRPLLKTIANLQNTSLDTY